MCRGPKIRVLALVTDAFGGYGGIAQYNQDFLNALSDCRDVEFIRVLPRLASRNSTSQEDNLRQYSASQNKYLYAFRSAWLALRYKPELIFCGHLYHGPLAHGLARLLGAKLISQLHGTEVWNKLPKKLLKPLRASDLVLCVSQDTKRHYLEQAGYDNTNADVVHNTFNEMFYPGERTLSRKKYALTNEFMILTVGRLDPRNGGYKGHERILRSLYNLRAGAPKIVYFIAGDGDDRSRLESLVTELKLDNVVQFLGKVPSDELPDLYRAADLFALPSTGEGFGIVYLEAMACGTSAIGLNIGGAPDALSNGDLGWCVEPSDFERSLQSAISSTPEDRDTLSRKVSETFGPQTFCRRVQQSISKVLAPNPNASC